MNGVSHFKFFCTFSPNILDSSKKIAVEKNPANEAGKSWPTWNFNAEYIYYLYYY